MFDIEKKGEIMEGTLSPADVAVLSGNNRGNSDGMFGDNGAWWIIIFLIFAMTGWGRNGFGGGSNGSDSNMIYPNYVLSSDFSQLSRQVSDGFNSIERRTDGIINGICDLGYNQLNLSNGINQNVSNGFYNTLNAITTNGYETRLGQNAISQNISNCCCELREGLANINFNNAQNTCSITNAITMNTRDIIDNQNNNYRQLHEEIINNRLADKEAQIQAQQNEINALRLKASQEAQNNYLINELKPCPKASYIVQPPQQVSFPTNCCNQFSGFNNGCGCNGY